MAKYNTLIFDFDYTLADSSEAVIECVNYALDKLGLPRQNPHAIKKTIGKTLPDTFEVFSGHRCPKTVAEFRKYFREKADQVMTAKTHIFEYVPDVIRLLDSKGFSLAIVSTKFSHRIKEILGRDNLTEFFSVIIGGEDVGQNKPHPESLLKAIDLVQADKRKSLYIGDSLVDAQTADRAGIDFLAVLSGVTGKEEFDGYDPIGFISDLRELEQFLEASH